MLGIRLDPETERGLAALARAAGRTKSAIARELIARHVRRHNTAYLAEARRQSLAAAAAESQDDVDHLDDLAAALSGTE